MDGSTEVGREQIPPDGYLQPKKQRSKLRCLRCGHVYYSKPYVVVPKVDPPCPREACRVEREVERRLAERERVERMLEERRPPGTIGSRAVGLVDRVAEQVMRDYKLTDLNDNMRTGDIAAPKLPAAQQRAADSFFTGQEVARRFGGRRLAARVAQLGAQVLGARGPVASANIAKIQAAAGRSGESAFVARPTGEPHMFNFTPRSG